MPLCFALDVGTAVLADFGVSADMSKSATEVCAHSPTSMFVSSHYIRHILNHRPHFAYMQDHPDTPSYSCTFTTTHSLKCSLALSLAHSHSCTLIRALSFVLFMLDF
jgi:hypothetical protein